MRDQKEQHTLTVDNSKSQDAPCASAGHPVKELSGGPPGLFL